MTKKLLYYAEFTPQDDITIDEVVRIFNGLLTTIAEQPGFRVVIDDSVSLDDALHFTRRLNDFVWGGGIVAIGDDVAAAFGDMMRHFDIQSTFELGVLTEDDEIAMLERIANELERRTR